MTLSAIVKRPTAKKLHSAVERLEKQWSANSSDPPVFAVTQAYNAYEDCKVATIVCRSSVPQGFRGAA